MEIAVLSGEYGFWEKMVYLGEGDQKVVLTLGGNMVLERVVVVNTAVGGNQKLEGRASYIYACNQTDYLLSATPGIWWEAPKGAKMIFTYLIARLSWHLLASACMCIITHRTIEHCIKQCALKLLEYWFFYTRVNTASP